MRSPYTLKNIFSDLRHISNVSKISKHMSLEETLVFLHILFTIYPFLFIHPSCWITLSISCSVCIHPAKNNSGNIQYPLCWVAFELSKWKFAYGNNNNCCHNTCNVTSMTGSSNSSTETATKLPPLLVSLALGLWLIFVLGFSLLVL